MADLEVDGKSYEVFELTGRQGLMWPYRLAKYMRGFVPSDGDNFDLSSALGQFFNECTEENFISFAEGMLDSVHKNGKSMKGLYTVEFKGDIPGLYRLLIAVCKFHFSGFFSELQSFGFSKAQAETKQKIAD